MLVLTRRVGESVVIGHEVTVTVLEVRGEVIRLGIDAPRRVPVHREEVFRELQEANRASAAADEATAELLAASLGPASAGRTGRASRGSRPRSPTGRAAPEDAGPGAARSD